MRGGTRRLHTATAVLAGIGVLASAAVVVIVPALPEASPSLVAAVEAAEARAMARNDGRAVLHGDGRDGVAFDHYVRATRRVGTERFWWDRELEVVRNRGRVVRLHELTPLRAEWNDVLEELAAGARCRDTTLRPCSDCSPMRFAGVVQTEIELRLSEGRALDAVRAWLDLTTFLLDLDAPAANGLGLDTWTGYAVLQLPDAAADVLAAGLPRIEARLRAAPDPAAALVPWVRPLLDGHYSLRDWHWTEVLAAAPWDFDASQRHLAAFAELFARLDRLDPPATTGAARDAQWRAFDAELPRTITSHLVNYSVERAAADERAQRCVLSRLLHLRLGLAFRAGVPLPPLLDPHTGAPFTTDVVGDMLVVTSADAGGGAWSTRWLRRG